MPFFRFLQSSSVIYMCLRVSLPFLKPPDCVLLIDVKPEFDKDITGSHQVVLHGIDLIVSTPPHLFGTEAFDTLNKDPAVPAAVKDGDIPMLGSIFINRQR